MVDKITAEIDGASPQVAATHAKETVASATDEANIKEDIAPQFEANVDAGSDNTVCREENDYEEESDQELFAIFLENLREKIELVSGQAAGLESSTDKVALLERCAENLQGLYSAANYMGYEELTTIYSNWLEDIVAVQDALLNNEDIPYDFMDGYISEIKSLFSQLKWNVATSKSEPLNIKEEISQQSLIDDGVKDSNAVDGGLLPDYLIEAAEHLEEMESLLLKLAEEPDNIELMNEIFRPIHSIKGAAQFIGLERSSRLAHRLEDLLDLLRKRERQSSPEVVELLISARDLIVKLVDELEDTQTEMSSVDDMVQQITAAIEATASHDTNAECSNGTVQIEASVNSVYEEENDEELFAIFIENLQQKIDLIHVQADEFHDSTDRASLLEHCVESLKGLYSAANYMGYEELTKIYRNWLEDITEVQQALLKNEEVPDDFMDGYLSEIYSLFPQLERRLADTNVGRDNNTGIDASPEPRTIQSDSVAGVTATADDASLYEKLNKAFDAATLSTDEVEYELLHGVFEEMISEKENISVPAHRDAVQIKTEVVKQAITEKTDAIPGSNEIDKQSPAKQEKQNASKDKKTASDLKAEKSVVKKSVRVDAEKIDSLINQVGELVVDRAYFFQLFEDMRGLQQHFKDDIGLDQKEMKQIRAFTYRMGEAIASLSRTSNELQEGVMKVRMLPISQLFNRYPRLVHDLTRNKAKIVNLKVEGEDTELDKMVVEKLSDPLIHIIRNAIDHGLENTQDRIAAGKPETGTLFLKSYHESNQVVVEIFDDGRGIDPDVVKAKAIEKGIVSQSEADRMLPQEVVRLITTAGFSTAAEITDTSGRGVGMDVVRKNIEKLNGTLEIDSRLGKGTSIRLKIPLTLAIIPAHLVKVGGNMYTIPLANIEETLRIRRTETTIIEGTEVVYLRGKTLPIIHLSTLFSTDSYTKNSENFFVVVVNTGTQKIGLVVDELLGQEEVVIKPLVEYLRDESGFSGATIIGDGSISLILDIYEIAKMTVRQQINRQHELLASRRSGNAGGQLGQVAV